METELLFRPAAERARMHQPLDPVPTRWVVWEMMALATAVIFLAVPQGFAILALREAPRLAVPVIVAGWGLLMLLFARVARS
jgi:small-conductance mechanosensitive channel